MSHGCKKSKCRELKKCNCNRLPESCIVVVQRTPPATPLFPPNANTPQDVVTRSCLNTCNMKRCCKIVEEIYCTSLDLQNAYREVSREKILKIFADGVVYENNGVIYVGKAQFITSVLDPELLGQKSINPDYSLLTFQLSLLDDSSATQYGVYPTTYTTTAGVVTTLSRQVVISWIKVCGYWYILNVTSTNLLL